MTFWYSKHSPWSYLLYPIAMVYRLLIWLRRWTYRVGIFRTHYFSVPIVVVGNITVGGTGKTPCVRALCALFKANGLKPGVVMRGYGGRSKRYPLQVKPDDEVAEVGDEALMLATDTGVPVVVAPKRVQAVTYLLAHHDCDVVISDDGLQHYAMDRDIEIALFNGERGAGNGLCLPAGPLREPLSRLQRVDCVLMTSTKQVASAWAAKAFCADLVPGDFVSLIDGERSAKLDTQNCHAVAAIGNPEGFFKSLRSLGYAPKTSTFRDHHLFKPEDIQVEQADCVVMTEKDAVKCRAFADKRYWYLSVQLQLPEEFCNFVLGRVREVS